MSQGALSVPTTGPVSPTTMAGDINAATAALGTNNSGAASPTNGAGSVPLQFQWWADSSTIAATVLKRYDGTSWVALATLDTVNHVWQYIAAGILKLTGVISPTALAADTNDYAPTDFAKSTRLRLTASSDVATVNWNITGLAGGAEGRVIWFDNVNTNAKFTIKSQNAGSTAANRFAIPFDIRLRPGESIGFMYDGTSSRWRLQHPYRGPGMTVTAITATGTYTVPAGVTWIKVRLVGAGGGTGTGGVPGAGGFSAWDTAGANVVATGGVAGGLPVGVAPGAGGAPPAAGAGTATLRLPGGAGMTGCVGEGNGAAAGNVTNTGGHGGKSQLGAGTRADQNGGANTGDGAGGITNADNTGGRGAASGGASSGEYVEVVVNNPNNSYAVTIGAAGVAGT